MGSAEVLPPPPSDYLAAYYFSSAEFAISSVALRRTKVARFSDLNDPFELLAINAKHSGTRYVLNSWKVEIDAQKGMLCFSSDWTNPVLWSHYANKHRGICLGFWLRRDRAIRVQYQERRLSHESIGILGKLSEDTKNVLLCTKYVHWEYEKEIRMLIDIEKTTQEGNLSFCAFDTDIVLKEIILGPQCLIDLHSIRYFVDTLFSGVVVYKARLADKHFGVVPDGDTVL